MARVLFVDDEINIRKLVSYDLKHAGFDYDVCENGEEALELIHKNNYDVCIIDWMMPKLSGIELVKKIRSESYDAILFMLTAKDEEEDIVEAFEAGVDDYLEIVKDSNFEKLDLLRGMRDELNVNLERLSVCEKETLQSKFLGVFNLWMRRYENFLPLNDDAKETFAVIEKLLDGQKRNFLEVLKMLQKTGLGLAGAGFVLYAVMIATSTGVGIAAAFHTWLLGIPFGQVFGSNIQNVITIHVTII